MSSALVVQRYRFDPAVGRNNISLYLNRETRRAGATLEYLARQRSRFRSRMGLGDGVQLRGVSTGKNGRQSAPAQFRNNKAASVSRRAKDGDRSIRLLRPR